MGIEITEQGEIDVAEQDLVEDEVDDVAEAVETASEPDPHDEVLVAVAENEGMIGAPLPVPAASKTPYEQILEAERADAIERAIVEVCEAQEIAAGKKDKAEKAAVAATDAKASLKAADEELRDAALRLRRLREGRNPDTKRYPLLDKEEPPDARDATKAEIDSAFPAPAAIQPLPADGIEEFFRRKKRDTKLADLGLTGKVDDILAAVGLVTIADLDRIYEGGADLTTISAPGTGSITEHRQEKILDAIAEKVKAWKAEWDTAHPEPVPAEASEALDAAIAEEGGDDA